MPVELRRIILDIAADPDNLQPRPKWCSHLSRPRYSSHGYGNEALKDEVLDSSLVHIPNSRNSYPYEWLKYLQRPDDRERDDLYIRPAIFRTRFALLGTSRLARLVSLEAWKRDLEMSVGLLMEKPADCALDMEGLWHQFRCYEVARTKRVIESVEMLIGEVRRRIEEN